MRFRYPFRPKPATLEDGLAIIRDAICRTLQSGLQGFVLCTLNESGSTNAEVISGCKGNIEQGLAHVLKTLLSNPDTKSETLNAIFAALIGTSTARLVQAVDANDDCDCSICTLRREVDEACEPIAKFH